MSQGLKAAHMYTNNEILFPHHVIPALKKLRGPKWQTLIERIAKLPETHEESLAFMMMMIRLDGCMACETDSYRAMRGCAACALQTLRRYKGEDDELIIQFSAALEEVQKFAENHTPPGVVTDEKRML
ncbi:MAG: hypothetical protein H0X30_06020 [Anaerolineae bacterium]|nr:hypothetical protein [Anaerolineae bacterium]